MCALLGRQWWYHPVEVGKSGQFWVHSEQKLYFFFVCFFYQLDSYKIVNTDFQWTIIVFEELIKKKGLKIIAVNQMTKRKTRSIFSSSDDRQGSTLEMYS